MVEREQGGEVGDDILMEFRGGGQRVLCLGSGLCICIEHCATGGGQIPTSKGRSSTLVYNLHMMNF